jgi:hypothetical protein
MTNKVIFFLLLSFLNAFHCISQSDSANQKRLLKYNISEKLQKDWQMDTKGCNKIRQKYYCEIKANKTLIGISVKELSTIFGRPDTLKNQNPF